MNALHHSTPFPNHREMTPIPHFLKPVHATPIPPRLFPRPRPDPQGVTISPHGAVNHHPMHFKRHKRESEANAESVPEASGKSSPTGDSQFGSRMYDDLFKHLIENGDGSEVLSRDYLQPHM